MEINIYIKRVLILVTICILSISTITASDYKQELMDMTPYERTVLIIKYYETMHYNQGKYIGYGHCILPGESYKKNERLTKTEADLLLRRDVYRLYNMFCGYGEYAWLLTALSYNVGPYAVLGTRTTPKSTLLRLIESGADQELIRQEYVKFCHIKGKATKSIYRRRAMEFELLMSE